MITSLTSYAFTVLTTLWFALPSSVQAAVYNGGGLGAGLGASAGINGPSKLPIRALIIKALDYVLNFLALAGVIAVVVAGIYLIVSNGDEENKEKAKKIIIYVIVGLIIVLMAKVIVQIPLNALS